MVRLPRLLPAACHRSAGAHETVSPFTPDTLEVAPRHVVVGGDHVATFAVTGYPREVYPGWLQPLLTYPGRVDVSLHVEVIDSVTAAARLKRQLARLESSRRHDADHGRLHDPQLEVAAEDAYDLAARVARGEGRLFRLGLYLAVRAPDQDTLTVEVAAVRALAASLLLDVRPASYRSVQGWTSCLPLGLDQLGLRRTFDTAALSAAFPFTSPDLPAPDPASLEAPAGVLYGWNLGSPGLVHWDRFALGPGLHNHNAVILGRSGAGKSYAIKLEALRSLYRGVEVVIIDPEDEYRRLCEAVGGVHIQLGAPGVRINPFDLPIHRGPDGRRSAPKDALIRRALFLHTVLALLLDTEPTAAERAILDTAIMRTYQQAGITTDPRSWTRPAPTLPDLRTVLTAMADPAAGSLAERLHPYTDGAYAGLFTGPTSTEPDGHLIVFSLRDLPEELQPIGTLLTLDAIWRRITNPATRRPRLVDVDEAWLLMHRPAGAAFLYRMAKAARKHWAGLTVATQDAADVLGSDLGRAVVANAATQILLRQAPQTIDDVVDAFHLSSGERQFLLSAERGQGLLAAGTQRVAFETIASDSEHALATSSPDDLSDLDQTDTGLVDLDAAA